MKTARLRASHVVPTFGEFACEVLSKPWTIHGWRPSSVISQPASAPRNGKAIETTAVQRNQRERSSRQSQKTNEPTSGTRETSVPMIAIPRNDQYLRPNG